MSSPFSIERALVGLPQDMYVSAKGKLDELRDVVKYRVGLELRDDSRLAWAWVTGNLPGWTTLNVSDELALNSYLHCHTHYNEITRSVLPAVRQTLEDRFCGDRNAAWDFVHRFVVPIYRMQAMLEVHPDGDFPKIWPWQQEDCSSVSSDSPSDCTSECESECSSMFDSLDREVREQLLDAARVLGVDTELITDEDDVDEKHI